MEQFTLEEINLMCIYGTDTREGLVRELAAMSTHLEADETELTELTKSVLKKLHAMTDDEYAALADTLIPDYEEEQEE